MGGKEDFTCLVLTKDLEFSQVRVKLVITTSYDFYIYESVMQLAHSQLSLGSALENTVSDQLWYELQ